jgi:HD-GYP domain-containing protein (c-di-GMP phosphodiesterase class II)
MQQPTPPGEEIERLSEQLGDAYEELTLLHRLSQNMGVARPTDEFLAGACVDAADTVTACGVGVLTWDPQLGEAINRFEGGLNLKPAELSRLARTLQPRLTSPDDFVCCNRLNEDDALAWLFPAVRQVLAVPIGRQGQVMGCVLATDKDVGAELFGIYNHGVFTSIDRKFLSGVAMHVGLFLENRRLFTDAEGLMMGLLHSMVAAVDAKDAYTCGHSVRVALYARRLAQAIGRDEDACSRVYLAGLLHDVGKIGIDDTVIRKPGRLTDEEFDQIKRHPSIGHRILERVPRVADILPGVLHHHEKFDGTGYPEGLAGQAIPAMGRLLCIADSFDAMTSSRTYRSARPMHEALAEVERCAGTHFDPEMATTFCRIPASEFEWLARQERDGDLPNLTGVASHVYGKPIRRAA